MRSGAAISPAVPPVRPALATVVTLVAVTLAGCSADVPSVEPTTGTTTAPSAATEARAALAAAAAAAEDRHFSALYTLTTDGRPDRTVTVTSAGDGTWRVDIPGGALSGTVDIAVARTGDGVFQCSLQSAQHPDPPACVRVAAPDAPVPVELDPRVQHPFTDWLGVLTDEQAPLAVSKTTPLPDARGTCYSVESTSASLNPPLDVGIYCYQPDGTLTAARLGFGTLRLAGPPAAAPATVSLPGPVVGGEPLAVGGNPPPDGTPSTSGG